MRVVRCLLLTHSAATSQRHAPAPRQRCIFSKTNSHSDSERPARGRTASGHRRSQNGSFEKSRRNAGQNPWRGARTFPHRTSRPCLMRGGKSHLRGFDERERASWLRIRSTHLEWCMGALLAAPAQPPKPRTQQRLAAATTRKARFGQFIGFVCCFLVVKAQARLRRGLVMTAVWLCEPRSLN